MSRANPRKAVAAAMPLPVRAGGVEVRPMTLAMWAALERIDSPMLPGRKPPKDTLELLPSLYLLVHGPEALFKGALVKLALAWADGLPVTALADIRAACTRQMSAVADVVPELDEEDAARKKKRTAPSPTSSTSPARPSAGATAKPFTKPRSPSSRSSTGMTRSRRTASTPSR